MASHVFGFLLAAGGGGIASGRFPRPTTTTPKTLRTDPPSGLNVEIVSIVNQSRTILCLDIPSASFNGSAEVTLLNDTENGVLLTGILHSNNYGDFRKFSEVRMTINGTLSVKVSTGVITLGPKSYGWFQITSLSMDGLRITANRGLEFTTHSELIITLNKFGLQTRRSLSNPYIIATVKNPDRISPDATGLLALPGKDLQVYVQVNVLFRQNGVYQFAMAYLDQTAEGERCSRLNDLKTLGAIFG